MKRAKYNEEKIKTYFQKRTICTVQVEILKTVRRRIKKKDLIKFSEKKEMFKKEK